MKMEEVQQIIKELNTASAYYYHNIPLYKFTKKELLKLCGWLMEQLYKK